MAAFDARNSPRCPECGLSARLDRLPRAWWWRWRRVWQSAALVVAIAAVALMQWRHWPPAPVFATRPPGIGSVDFPPEPITRFELEAMAEPGDPAARGDRIASAMAEVIEMGLMGDRELLVAIGPIRGDRCDFVRWGWPCDLVTLRYDAVYDDVYQQAGATPPALRGRTGLVSGALVGERIDRYNRRETRIEQPYNLGVILLVVIVAWIGGVVIRFGCVALGISRRFGTSRRARWTRRLPLAAGAGAAALALSLSVVARSERGYMLPAVAWPAMSHTGLTLDQCAAIAREQSSDATFAAAMLAALPPDDQSGVLLIGWDIPRPMDHAQVRGGWPRGIQDGGVYRYTLPDSGTARTDREGPHWSVDWGRGYAIVRRYERVGVTEQWSQITFSLAHAAWPLLGVFGAWMLAGVPIRLAMWRTQRRWRRRWRHGQCIRCGYEGVREMP